LDPHTVDEFEPTHKGESEAIEDRLLSLKVGVDYLFSVDTHKVPAESEPAFRTRYELQHDWEVFLLGPTPYQKYLSLSLVSSQ
jgi:hypothetical protein